MSIDYSTAEKRWAGIGPYYAMFPRHFADEVILKYTRPNDVILDPFSGRATSIYSAAINERTGIGIEVNPVGWVYGKSKLYPADQCAVEKRLIEIYNQSDNFKNDTNSLPAFFHSCFSSSVLNFLLSARENLDWRYCSSDWTLMSLLLVYLHGNRTQSLSNQMRQTKSMAPEYSIRWWKEHDLKAPEIDPLDFMRKRISWRYMKGKPKTTSSHIYLGNCCDIIPKLKHIIGNDSIKLLFTSPPYSGITNYHYDQWIRLWLLGYPPYPNSNMGRYRKRFSEISDYSKLLETTFRKSSKYLSKDSIIYIRTDSREPTFSVTKNILNKIFPKKKLSILEQPVVKNTQTHLFGKHVGRNSEVDLILE